ncbi:MAG TPA: DMT family transporter [Gammaproteobacteria bacterium]|nr:DMT family transporter [Gammaproteobacteria bacterium]
MKMETLRESLFAATPAIRSVYAALGASLMMAAMSTMIKLASSQTGNEMVVFLRSGFGLMFLLPGLWRRGIGVLATRRFAGHLARSWFGLSAMYCFFYAIGHMPLAEAVLLNYSSPIFTALIAWTWLGERASPKIFIAIGLGLLGVGLILKPGGVPWSGAAWVGAISAVLAALAMVNIRRMADTEPIFRIVFYFSLISVATSGVPLLWAWRTPNLHVLATMAAAGLMASAGQLLLTYSYSTAPAARVGTLSYSTVVFAALIGWVLWGERPDWLSVAGAVLIGTAGMLVTRRPPLPPEAD